MPRGDGTGPAGMGSMTGRAAGYCAGYGVPGYANPVGGFGYGRGMGWRWGGGYGRGFGWGRGMGFRGGRGAGRWGGWAPYVPPVPVYEPYVQPRTAAAEREYLEDEAELLKEELEAVQERLEELKKRLKDDDER